MTNYRKSMVESLAEVRGLQEDNMDMMRKAAGGAMQTIKMKDGKLQMDSFTASAIMQVYDKVNPANQKKMAVMINKGTKAGMLKLQSFAMKQVKSEYEPQLDEWTVSDVEIAMKKKYGKIDKEAIEKLKKVQHRGNVDRNDLVKAGHGKLDVAGLAYSKEEVDLDEAVKHMEVPPDAARGRGVPDDHRGRIGYDSKENQQAYNSITHGSPDNQIDVAKHFMKKGLKSKALHKAVADELGVIHWEVHKQLTHDKSKLHPLHMSFEGEELDEAKYELYHKDFSTAMQHAYKMAKKLYGITVDPKEIDDKVASGPRKPSSGKTNSYRLKGDKGAIQVQVYNMDRLRSHKQLPADKNYELNMYKEEVELDEGREKDARQLVNSNKEVMVVKKNRVVVINKKDQDKYLKQGWELAEEVELDEGIKVGDNVHLGFGAKGGTGFKGKVIKIDSNNVHIKNSEGKEYKGPMKFVTKEEVDLDEGKFERDMVTAKGISLQIRIIVTARNMIDDGKSDSEIMKTTKLSAGDVKKLRQDMSDRPGEYDEEAELEEGKMKELHGYIAQGKSAEWIAKKMKVDVESIKTLMAGYNESYEIGTDKYRGHCEKVTPGEGLDEANYEIKNGKIHISKANFRKVHKDYKNSTKGKERMMALDPKSGATTSYEVVFEAVDPADVDDNATDADRAAASKNIIHQLRKSIDQDGKFAVTFGDNKKVKVDAKIAKAINDKFMSIKRPPDKVKFQAQAAKSYKDMLKVLKNGFNEEIQKETILDRIDKKLKERKELHEASNRWELGGKKFSLVNDKGTWILVTQGTGTEKKLKAKTQQQATAELVKKGYRES